MKKIPFIKHSLIVISIFESMSLNAQQTRVAVPPLQNLDKLVMSSGKGSQLKERVIYTYHYDLSNRLQKINSSNNEFSYTFRYSSANNKNIDRVRVLFKSNQFVEATFQYNASGFIQKIVRTGLQNETLHLSFDAKNYQYVWTDSKNRKNILKIQGPRILSHQIGSSVFEFEYQKIGHNGLSRIEVPISLVSYLAMEYYNTDIYANGFLQALMPAALISVKDPRERGSLITFSNQIGPFTLMKSSTMKDNNGETFQWTYSYKPANTTRRIPDKAQTKSQIRVNIK